MGNTQEDNDRMREKNSKFVQIAATVAPSNDGLYQENLYALDEAGEVWWFDFEEGEWGRLGITHAEMEGDES